MESKTLILVIGLLIGLALIYGYVSFIGPHLEFEQQAAGCAQQETSSIEFFSGERRIDLSGNVITPNPCYDLAMQLRKKENRLTIIITTVPQPGPCIDCIGSIEYRGSIKGLGPGTYMVEVIYNGESIALKEVEVR